MEAWHCHLRATPNAPWLETQGEEAGLAVEQEEGRAQENHCPPASLPTSQVSAPQTPAQGEGRTGDRERKPACVHTSDVTPSPQRWSPRGRRVSASPFSLTPSFLPCFPREEKEWKTNSMQKGTEAEGGSPAPTLILSCSPQTPTSSPSSPNSLWVGAQQTL